MQNLKIVFLGFLGGIIAVFLLLSLPGSGPFIFGFIKADLNNFLGTAPTPTPTSTLPDLWQKIVSDHSLSAVAVQSFKDGKIIREGSGMVVSSDGAAVTTFDIVSGADMLQVFYKDKILRARVMKYDGFKNLAVIKVNDTNMDVARLDTGYQFQAGQDVVVSGKMVQLSIPVVFAQRGMTSRVLSKDVILNTDSNYFLSGSKVINNSGVVVGMAYLRSGTVRLITAETVDNFIKSYFQASE